MLKVAVKLSFARNCLNGVKLLPLFGDGNLTREFALSPHCDEEPLLRWCVCSIYNYFPRPASQSQKRKQPIKRKEKKTARKKKMLTLLIYESECIRQCNGLK